MEVSRLVPTYLDNLSRLGLISIPESYSYTGPNVYDELENIDIVVMAKNFIEQNQERTCNLVRGAVVLTNLGRQFGSVCVQGRD